MYVLVRWFVCSLWGFRIIEYKYVWGVVRSPAARYLTPHLSASQVATVRPGATSQAAHHLPHGPFAISVVEDHGIVGGVMEQHQEFDRGGAIQSNVPEASDGRKG